jgi:hypothetical protein
METNDFYFERMEEQAEKHYQMLLRRAPHCRDPEHPGCEDCMENDDEEN